MIAFYKVSIIITLDPWQLLFFKYFKYKNTHDHCTKTLFSMASNISAVTQSELHENPTRIVIFIFYGEIRTCKIMGFEH